MKMHDGYPQEDVESSVEYDAEVNVIIRQRGVDSIIERTFVTRYNTGAVNKDTNTLVRKVLRRVIAEPVEKMAEVKSP
jgi:hypothetical protein